MGRLERLRARQLPTETVTLPASGGGEPEVFELRALLPERWDEIQDEHPPTPEQEAKGAGWNTATFRPALIAESVVTPDGEEPLTAADWADLTVCGHMTGGELNILFNVAWALNDRSPLVSVGKDSPAPRSS